MSPFLLLAFLMPLVMGLLFPALLSFVGRRRPGKAAFWAAGVPFTVVLLLLLFWAFSERPFLAFWGTVLLSLAVGCFGAGLFLFFRGLRFSPDAAQVTAGLAVVFALSSVFLLGSVVNGLETREVSREEGGERIHFLLAISPYPVMAASLFQDNPFVRPGFYATKVSDYYPPEGIPSWSVTAVRYGLAGLLLGLIGLGLCLLGKKPVEGVSP